MDPSFHKGQLHPVERVSWFEVVEFCQRLSARTQRSYRLPSEAEWEYACRAGTTTPFYFGETITTDLANYKGDYPYSRGPKGPYREKTTLVGHFPANAFGLHDMHGNIWEWCQDDWHETYKGSPSNGQAWIDPERDEDTPKVLRGGSWGNLPWYCRSADRLKNFPGSKNKEYGFRLVLAQDM